MATQRKNPSDSEVVLAVRDGQTNLFATLVDRYQKPLLRVAYVRLGRWDFAEDVVQETFVRAFRSLHSYDSRYSFRTWLWTIAINLSKRQYARHKKREEIDDVQTEVAVAADQRPGKLPGPQELAMQRERSQQLNLLLTTLPDAQAEALQLRFFAGLKFNEMADVMGCSLSTAKNRVRWGLEKIAGQIEDTEQKNSVVPHTNPSEKT